MKRVVVQVGPVEPDSANDESKNAATTVETFVAEENAELLLATVLSLNGRTSLKSSDRIVELLVKRELLLDPSGNKIKLYWAGENRLNPPWRVERRA